MSVRNVQRVGLATLFAMLFICTVFAFMTRPAHGQNYAWDTGKWAGATDLRGKGVVMFDSARTAGGVIAAAITADSSVVGTVVTARDSVYKATGQALELSGAGGYASVGYLRVESDLITAATLQAVGNISAYPATTPSITGFKTISAGLSDVDSINIGGGATITKADTSAAGDSLKVEFVNGNKGLIFNTEVKP